LKPEGRGADAGPGSSAGGGDARRPWLLGSEGVETKEEVVRPNAVLSLLSSPHTCPVLFGTSCPVLDFHLLFLEPFCLLRGAGKALPADPSPHRSRRQPCLQPLLLWPGPSWQGTKSRGGRGGQKLHRATAAPGKREVRT